MRTLLLTLAVLFVSIGAAAAQDAKPQFPPPSGQLCETNQIATEPFVAKLQRDCRMLDMLSAQRGRDRELMEVQMNAMLAKLELQLKVTTAELNQLRAAAAKKAGDEKKAEDKKAKKSETKPESNEQVGQ